MVAREKVAAMTMENALLLPSRDWGMTALVLAAEALAMLKAVMAAAMVLAAEAAAAFTADDTNGGNSGLAIVGRGSLTAGGGYL